MAGKRFDVCTPRPGSGDKTFWLKVGSAWQNENGLITVYLDSFPMPSSDPKDNGKAKMMLFEPRDQNSNQGSSSGQGKSAAKGKTAREQMDDEIPF